MSWKTAYRSIYYRNAPEPEDLDLRPDETALLVIDIQNTYLERPDRESLTAIEKADYDAWTPFHERMHNTVIPGTADLLKIFRKNNI
ncbi:MAG TPA: amidase, partial [Rhizobiales bacterium]|nr:amidase [Hyphomicrobiales bacterium]